MDNPDKFLSSEFDLIYVNQAEELTLDDWEKLGARASGRAGNMPYAMIFGDCNPDVGTHWIVNRAGLKVLKSTHRDNPILYDPETGEITEQGERTISILKRLTSVRYKRGYQGLWVGSEGMVYEGWQEAVHMLDRFDIPEDWPRYRCIDFGFRNPFVCAWWAVDHDGNMYRYREIYMTERTVRAHAEQINKLSEGESYVANIADHDASDRATLAENGIHTVAANKDILAGIEKVQQRLVVKENGKPGIFFLRDSLVEVDESLKSRYKPTCTEEEFPGYVFPERKEGRADDEKPVKVDDHGMDEVRYMVMYLDSGTKFSMDWV
jgi:phage terminase large subunit